MKNKESDDNQKDSDPKRLDSIINEDINCGIGILKPNWMQPFAGLKSYALVYGLLGLNNTAIGSYFFGTITSIEKRFKIPSLYSGMMSSVWDFSSTIPLLLFSYCGGAQHKTRWIAKCTVLTCIACYVITIPHYIFGPGDTSSFQNITNSHLLCNEEPEHEYCAINSEGRIAFLLFCLANALIGIGTSIYGSLGPAYLDDNVSKDKFPAFLGITSFLATIGPTFGYMISGYTLSIYIDPHIDPTFDENDSRWIGSWYIGWIGFGLLSFCMAFLMALFPKTLRKEPQRRKSGRFRKVVKEERKEISVKDFKRTMLRILKNPVIIFSALNIVFYNFGMTGFGAFMPKYIETQFGQSASAANIYTGSAGIFSSAIGVMISGLVISKFKPGPCALVGWTTFTQIVDVVGHFSFTFLSCYKNDLHGVYGIDNAWNLTTPCNSGCDCGPQIPYSPVCSSDGIISTTFFSPCHAGCTQSSVLNGIKTFTNCSCASTEVVDGACSLDCISQFHIFLVMLFVMRFLSATSRASTTIVLFRSVLPEDKAIASAVCDVVTALLVHVPGPVVFGLLFDRACLVWGSSCASDGNCLLYHGNDLRDLINYTTTGCVSTAVLFGFGLLYSVRHLKIYDEDDDSKESRHDDNNVELTELAQLNNSILYVD